MELKCPSCARPQPPRLICSECGSPLGAEIDCFAALGLPRRLVLDLADLERRYHALGREVHPDRFAGAAATMRAASLTSTALLTRSYRTLRDPVSRGLYWLELSGASLAENNKGVAPDLAALVFEVQEELAELTAADERGRATLAAQAAARRAELRALIDAAMDALGRNFARWDESAAAREAAGNDNGESSRNGGGEKLLAELKTTLSRIAYLRTLLRDIDRALEPAQSVADRL